MSDSDITVPKYTSVYRHGVDEKRRLQIPSKWRTPAQDPELTMVLWPSGFDKDACLTVFPSKVVQQMIDKLAEKPFNDPDANALRRFIGERADTAMLDKAGRICLPEQMAKAIGVGNEAVLVGLMDRFQIWNPKRYLESKAAVEGIAAAAWQKF